MHLVWGDESLRRRGAHGGGLVLTAVPSPDSAAAAVPRTDLAKADQEAMGAIFCFFFGFLFLCADEAQHVKNRLLSVGAPPT